MFNELDQLKAFMLWCKAEGVQHFEDDELAFDFSPIVLAPLLSQNAPEPGEERSPPIDALEALSELDDLD